ncbi:uncharacterized protein EAF01_006760 [Botrytis porri]|uniref:uncharacterized protein n=1 Tax=Botrytis porri TaxID=87229 RepID=UPI001900CAD7|nr:uncharacterized protein EAF01_006760 [Botrytis porri]KAF7903711.1 hypothetical protein EAF01_006760 [Botrytis porri]
MAMSVFAPNMSPITENLPVSAAEVQPLIGSSASERNLRELIKSPIVAPTVEELASHPSTTDSSLSTITNISKAQQITSSDSFITISLQEQIAKALVLPRLKRHHAMPAYFSVKGNLNSKLSHLRTRRCTQCERHRLQYLKESAHMAYRLLNFKASDKNKASEQSNTEVSQIRGLIALEHRSVYERQSTDDTIPQPKFGEFIGLVDIYHGLRTETNRNIMVQQDWI